MTKYILTTSVEIHGDVDLVQEKKLPQEAERAIREFLSIWETTLQDFTHSDITAILSEIVSKTEGKPEW